jgi:hypothetical protein
VGSEDEALIAYVLATIRKLEVSEMADEQLLDEGAASRTQSGPHGRMVYDEEAPPPDRPRGGMMPHPGKAPSQREADAKQYRRARKGLVRAMEMLDTYEEMGVRPCDIAVLHQNIRSAFGYG